MEKNQKTISQIISEAAAQMCDKYCKFPDMYSGEDEEKLISEHCENCPLVNML